MKATRIDPPVVVPPPSRVTLEMSLAQAKTLKKLMYWTMTIPGALAQAQAHHAFGPKNHLTDTEINDLMADISYALDGVVVV